MTITKAEIDALRRALSEPPTGPLHEATALRILDAYREMERERDEAIARAADEHANYLAEWEKVNRTIDEYAAALHARAEAAESALAAQKEETARAVADAAVMREAIGHVGEWDSLTFNAAGVAKLRAALATNAGAGLLVKVKAACDLAIALSNDADARGMRSLCGQADDIVDVLRAALADTEGGGG